MIKPPRVLCPDLITRRAILNSQKRTAVTQFPWKEEVAGLRDYISRVRLDQYSVCGWCRISLASDFSPFQLVAVSEEWSAGISTPN